METKHTKGEWIIKTSSNSKNIDIDAYYPIASLYGNAPRSEQEANAKIIAAAPELLEVLIEITKKLEITELSNKSTFNNDYIKSINIIKKATE